MKKVKIRKMPKLQPIRYRNHGFYIGFIEDELPHIIPELGFFKNWELCQQKINSLNPE